MDVAITPDGHISIVFSFLGRFGPNFLVAMAAMAYTINTIAAMPLNLSRGDETIHIMVRICIVMVAMVDRRAAVALFFAKFS